MNLRWTGNEIKHSGVQRDATAVAHDESGGVVLEAPAKAYEWFTAGGDIRMGEIGSPKCVFVRRDFGGVWTVTGVLRVLNVKELVRTPHLDTAIAIAQTWWDRPPTE